MYEVRDAYTPDVVSIDPDATIEAALHVLIENDVSGAPVVDKHGRLCGIISQFQLLEIAFDPEVRQGLVRDVMTRKVITVKENTLLATVANVLMVRRIRRLPVVREGKVVGIISRGDLVKYFAKTGERLRPFIDNLRRAKEDSRPVEQESEILASLIA
jgi:CBS domain-containing protein